MKAISARNLSKTYWYYQKETGLTGSIRGLLRPKKASVEAGHDINLDVELGEVVGFVGPNGAGKTTTLKMLSGILCPSSGFVEVMGFSPFKREKDLLKNISFVMGQRSRLFWDLPAEDYFDFCKVVYEIPDPVFQRNRRHLIELAEIGDILKVPQRKLSFGQRKRCELAAALLHDPAVIFLDEPTNALDLINAKKIRAFIKEKASEGKHAVLLTSHIISDIEETCDRILIINHGRIVYDGGIRDLIRADGLRKQIRVAFKGTWSRDEVEKLGPLKKVNSHEVLLEVNPDETAAAVSRLLASCPVKDISITEQPLEAVIESLYVKGKSKQGSERDSEIRRGMDCMPRL